MKIKIFVRIVALFGVLVAVILLTATVLLYIPSVQERAKKEAISYLRQTFNLDVKLERFSLRFPAKVRLQEALVMLSPTDTMLYAEKLEIRIALWPLLTKRSLHVNAVGLENAQVRLLLPFAENGPFSPKNEPTTSNANLATPHTDTEKSSPSHNRGPLIRDIDLERFQLKNVAILFNDSLSEFGLNLHVELLSATNSHLSLQEGSIKLGNLLIEKLRFEAEGKSADQDSTQGENSFPKTIALNQLEIRQSEGIYNDLSSGGRSQVLISYTNIEKGTFAFDSLQIALKEVDIRNSDFSMRLPDRATDVPAQGVANSLETMEEASRLATDSAGTWSIRIDKILFRNNTLHLDAPANALTEPQTNPGTPPKNIAPSYLHPFPLHIDNIRLATEKLYFNAHGAGAVINDFSLKEAHGFVLQQLSGAFHYDSSGVTIENLRIKSSESYAHIELSVPSTTQTDESGRPFTGDVDMQIAFADMAHFANLPLPADSIVGKDGKFSLQAAWEGSRQFPILNHLHFDWPRFLQVDADGSLSLPAGVKANLQRLTGSLHLKADFTKGPWSDWVMQLAKIDTGMPIPPSIKIQASADGLRGKFLVDLQAELLSGKATISGSVQPALKAFDLRLTVDSAQMKQLFTETDIGRVSGQLQLQLEANHPTPWDWGIAATGHVGPLEWRGRFYNGIRLEGALQGGAYTFRGESLDNLVQGSWQMTGTLADSLQTLLANFETPQLSFGLLGLSPPDLVVSGSLRLEAQRRGDSLLQISLSAPPSTLSLNRKSRSLPAFNATFASRNQKTELLFRSGDLTLSASADTGMVALGQQMPLLADSLSGWWQGNNPLPLQFIAPFRFSFSARKNNLLAQFFRPDSILWNQISLQGSSLQPAGFRGSGRVTGLTVSGIPIDSTLLQFEAISQAAEFDLRIASLPTNREYFSAVGLSGTLTPGTLATRFRFVDGKGTPMFHLETVTRTSDSLIRTHISNPEPIIGGEVCRVNDDNHISWHASGRLSGNLMLTGETLRVALRDVQRDSSGNGAISLQIKGLKLQRVLSLVPGMETLSGELHADGLFVSTPESMGIEGTLGIGGFRYKERTIGDIDMQLTHRRNTNMAHHITSSLLINNREALRAEGWYRPLLPDSALQLALTLADLPLATANAFSADYLTLNGYLQGNLSLTGPVKSPNIEGSILFREGKLHIVPTLANYTIGNDTLTIKNNILSIGLFRLTDANGRVLTLKGTAGLKEALALNLVLEAKNFQLLNVAQNNTKAIATGRALADISAQIRGTLGAPVVRSSLHLLRGTRISYVMRESLEPENDQEIVKFIALSDTARIKKLYSTVPEAYHGGVELTAQLQIEKDASLTLFFAGENGNRATVLGGGTLYYHLSPQSVASLTGTYTLEGGTLEYKPFVNASVVKNSTITWTGMPMNPELNLAAVKIVRTNVEQQDRMARPVIFNVFLRMQNSLERPTITFDVQAPADLAIQNQLATATTEEKQRQAVSLLVYGTYDLSGASTKNNEASSAINAFMENQLNKLARQTVKGVDLTFGVDSHTASGAETAGQGTDYSYKISKTFLNNRASLRVGGKVTTYDDPLTEGRNNLIDDISLEYVLNKTNTLFLRLFRQANYENLLEGEIIETGVSLMHRQQYPRFSDIFRSRRKKAITPSKTSTSPTNE